MKTDLVEIFQTIRASIQPYAAMGFDVKENSEKEFELTTESNEENLKKAVFFSSVFIEKDHVRFCLCTQEVEDEISKFIKPSLQVLYANKCFEIKELEDHQLVNIELALSEGFKLYKEKGWV